MKILFALFSMLFVCNTYSQSTEERAIKTTIDQFFTGMRNGDTAMIAATISSTALFQTIVNLKDGRQEVRTETVNEVLASLGRPHKEVYDEQIQYGAIQVDANLAAVWTPYKFYLDKTFSHCGVNSFQLVKFNNAWKIQYIIDTRRKENCR